MSLQCSNAVVKGMVYARVKKSALTNTIGDK